LCVRRESQIPVDPGYRVLRLVLDLRSGYPALFDLIHEKSIAFGLRKEARPIYLSD